MLREGLDYDQLKDMDFLGVVTKSRSNTLIQALKNFMDKLNPIMNLTGNNLINPRRFIAIYMISLHPTHVFEMQMTPENLEGRLFQSASTLVRAFDEICKASPDARLPLIRQFKTPLLQYMRDFEAWRIPDAERILVRVEHALVVIYNARQQLEETDNVIHELDVQIDRLRNKMAQLNPIRLSQFDAMRFSMAPPA